MLAGLVTPLSVPAAAWWLDRWGRRPADTGPWDVVVLAGCRVHPNGSPSSALQRRISETAALWHGGAAPLVVTTGGETAPGRPTEAFVAARGLRARGVPADVIRLEDRSRNTAENAEFTRVLLGGDLRVLVVSCHYHRWRCERLFAAHFSCVGSAGPVAPGWGRLLREVGSVADASWSGRL